MRKIVACLLSLVLVMFASTVAAESDYSFLDPDCPFEFRNGIKFGMTLDEVKAREDNELTNKFSAMAAMSGLDSWSTEVALGGLEGYELKYQFQNDILVSIEYFFEYPEVISYEYLNEGMYSNNQIIEFESWIDNISVIQEAMEEKYGSATKDESDEYEPHYIWNITFDNCLCGVDISVAAEYNPYIDIGGLWCNRITYTPHDYQSDIDALKDHQQNVQNTADSL